MKSMSIALAALALGACAAPQTARPVVDSGALAAEQQRQSLFVLESRAEEYRRVYDTAERISRANTDLCPRTAPVIGIRFENLNDYGRDFRAAARSLWGVSDTPSISWIGEQSAAAQAGLRLRDQLIAINGEAIRSGRQSSRQASDLLREAAARGAVSLQVRRGAEAHTVTIAPQLSCAYQFYVVDSDAINAAADGRIIMLSRGMLRFVRTDDELALVLGHELAHNAMRHIEAAQTNALMGAMGGAVLDVLAAAGGVNTGGAFTDAGGDIGRMMFSQEFESEADYVGLYFTARAGFDISASENFWRRMAAENPRGIRFAYTHPNTAHRYLGLAATRAEIEAKLARGEALRPNMSRDGAAAAQAAATGGAVTAPATAPVSAPAAAPAPSAAEAAPTSAESLSSAQD